jgi:hypothetical protein
MNESEILAYALALSGVVGTAIAVSRNLDSRFNALRKELQELYKAIGVNAANDINKVEMLEYRINENTNLIQHRTQRFTTELSRLKHELTAQVNDVKGYLERNSDFIPRKRDG